MRPLGDRLVILDAGSRGDLSGEIALLLFDAFAKLVADEADQLDCCQLPCLPVQLEDAELTGRDHT
jgi:hypothetical protein